ncbi:MAG: ATP-dependent Clp protease adaptor ClpS [Bradyrhizobium sp.]|nr:ATP-dependent Clp protease adaptor ClpS [Bradyrhizobium sp.]
MPLPYPLYPYGSRSVARDEISLLPDQPAPPPSSRREFPLHLPRGGSTLGHWRFEYAWFLLNKDVEAATKIMLHVHHHGIGECGVFTYEIAETKVTQVMDFARKHQHPLQCVMEKK